MTDQMIYGVNFLHTDWGCNYHEILGHSSVDKIKICHVQVNDLNKISEGLTKTVFDTSWMTSLDIGSKRAYERTVQETAAALVKVFEETANSSKISSEFGEVMVSIGSTKALEALFNHIVIPIAELWKPQVKQNEGFDFHTVCSENIINFGEAKYSSQKNPHGNAINQINGFINDEKHLRDYVHLVNLVSEEAINNFNCDQFGIVVAFSINSNNPLDILKNAIGSVQEKIDLEKIQYVYLVGVSK